jgi:predicted nucleic acid-binding protein
MSVLLDSDIVIEILRMRDQDMLVRWDFLAHSSQQVLYSPITAAEVLAGARPVERESIGRFFLALDCAAVDYAVGQKAGEYLLQFRKSHHLEIADALIAATAAVHRAELWTRNRKHYPMCEIQLF